MAPDNSQSEVTAFTVSFTIIECIYFSIALSLTVYSTYNGKWKTKSKYSESANLVLYTAISFLIGLLTATINYICVLIFGWSEGSISEYIFWIYSTAYGVALFLSILVWIKRLESVFHESAFCLSPIMIKTINGLYFMIILIGIVAMVLFVVSGNDIIIWIFSGLWILIFAVELILLMTLFITKLMKLRKMAMELTTSENHDVTTLEMLHRIWSLQVKLSILSLTSIISTVLMLIISFTVDTHHDLVVLGTDCFIGFICVYCALKQHDDTYKKLCVLCVKFCDCCCQSEHINTSLDKQIQEIHSRTSGRTEAVTISTGDTEATEKRSSQRQSIIDVDTTATRATSAMSGPRHSAISATATAVSAVRAIETTRAEKSTHSIQHSKELTPR